MFFGVSKRITLRPVRRWSFWWLVKESLRWFIIATLIVLIFNVLTGA